VITCNRCGSVNPADALQCRTCRTPLAKPDEQGTNTKRAMDASMSPELPAWLESLRAQERPLSSQSNAASFNAAGLIDDNSLPAWMRPEHGDDSKPSTAYGAIDSRNSLDGLRPSGIVAPNTDQLPREGISASSLIDEQSLPGWLSGSNVSSGTVPPQNISANELVNQDVLPAWMKSFQPQSAPVQSSGPIVSPSSSRPAQSTPSPLMSAPPASGFSARDLLDPQALPSWMTQGDQRTPQTPARPGQSSNGPMSPVQGELPPTRGFSASSLIDANSLPSWLRENNAQGVPRTGSSGVSWPTGTAGTQGTQDVSPMAPAAQTPQPPQPPMRQSGPAWSAAQPIPGMLDASSLMDLSALPDWLRPAAEQHIAQQGQGNSGQAQPAYMPPHRADNVRVPSRPRAEMGTHDGSEVAANVFASMLGVAATAPKFPTGSQGMAGVRPPEQMGPNDLPNAPRAGQSSQYGPPQSVAPAGTMGTPYTSGMMGASGPGPGQPLSPQSGQGYMPAATGSNAPHAASAPGTNMGVSSMSPGAGMMNPPQAEAKPAKKGLFEAIRNWLSRS
jgi:hypothetical protein